MAPAFPLEAYAAPAPEPHVNKAPRKNNHGDHSGPTTIRRPRSLYRVVQLSVLTILNLWVYFLVTTDLFRVACFNNVVGVPFDSIPAKVVCNQISPSFAQFWRKILEPKTSTQRTPTYLDIRITQMLEEFRRREIANYRPDFGLRGAGAFVLLGFTTPTFKPPHSNQAYDNSNHPSIVLEEQVIIGDCWEFFGFEGHIGIHLPEKINITEMTVSYAHPALIPHRMIKKAPRSITVWVLTDPGQFSVTRFRKPDEFLTTKRLPSFVQSGQMFLPILEAEYLVAPDDYNPVQAFRLSPNDFPASQIIVIEITSNWGSPTTCLHHFGIHGTPIEVDE